MSSHNHSPGSGGFHDAGSPHDLAPLYAVDALDPQERADFEQHLVGCAQCRAEVEDYSEVGASLAAGAAQEAPPELRTAVLSAISGARPLPAEEVTSLSDRRRRRTRMVLAAAAAAVLVPGIALGGWALGVQSEQREQEQIAAAEQGRENRLLAAPDVTTRQLDVNGVPATLVVSRDADSALFVAGDLPDPGEGREYQLWLLEEETPIPNVRFDGGDDVRIWLSGNVTDAGAVAMTVEPEGGSETPTLPLLASAEL